MTPASIPSPERSVEAYLQRERQREEKFEFDNGKEIPVGCASKEHNQIVRNLLTYLWAVLRERGGCEVYATDMKVYCPSVGKGYYPDLVITQGEEIYLDDVFDTLTNPVVLVEVLSERTKYKDRTEKFEAYRSLGSLKEYWLIAQDEYRAEGFLKNIRGEWTIVQPVLGLERAFHFTSLEIDIPMSEVYLNVAVNRENQRQINE